MNNSFGNIFRLTTFGESHGKAIGGIIDGCPAGHLIDFDHITYEMQRRKPGQSKIVTKRKEDDSVEFISGIFKTKSKNNFYVVGSILTSGTIIEWFKKIFNIKSYSDLDKILRSSKDKNIIFFPQFEFSHSPITLFD